MSGWPAICLILLGLASPVAAQPVTPQPEAGNAEADTDTVVAASLPPSRYGIISTHLPDSPGAPQVALSRGRYTANFGTREGVHPGSIFAAYDEGRYVGLVRVERVFRDTAHLHLVGLEYRPPTGTPEPLQRGFRLYPRYVLLESVNFGTGEPQIDQDMHQRLRYAARFILSFPDFPVVLEGHTDNTGARARNVELALGRARDVEDYMHDIQRVPRSQMFPVGYADDRPLVDNATAAGRRRNRRVDIVMVDQLPPEAAAQATRAAAEPGSQ